MSAKSKGEYTPHVYKFVISPYYANYSVFSKIANDDTDDWKMLANGASGKGIIKSMVLAEVEKIFEEYDYTDLTPKDSHAE